MIDSEIDPSSIVTCSSSLSRDAVMLGIGALAAGACVGGGLWYLSSLEASRSSRLNTAYDFLSFRESRATREVRSPDRSAGVRVGRQQSKFDF